MNSYLKLFFLHSWFYLTTQDLPHSSGTLWVHWQIVLYWNAQWLNQSGFFSQKCSPPEKKIKNWTWSNLKKQLVFGFNFDKIKTTKYLSLTQAKIKHFFLFRLLNQGSNIENKKYKLLKCLSTLEIKHFTELLPAEVICCVCFVSIFGSWDIPSMNPCSLEILPQLC